jgi:hypothetical protein
LTVVIHKDLVSARKNVVADNVWLLCNSDVYPSGKLLVFPEKVIECLQRIQPTS